MTKVYYAAPLHGRFEQNKNKWEVAQLRKAGIQVYLPQEHGLWEDLVQQVKQENPTMDEQQVTTIVRRQLFLNDKEAVRKCDMVVAHGTHVDSSPSEGMLWEMGYAAGLGKPVYLIPDGWEYNLMPEFGSCLFRDIEAVIQQITTEEFK